MKILRPFAYSVRNLNRKFLGVRRSLTEAVDLAQENGYLRPDLIQIYANYDDGTEQRIERQFYCCQNSNNLMRWLYGSALEESEKKVFKYQKLKERKCYNCNSTLDFEDFCYTNPSMSRDTALKLWDHQSVELYCCRCFRRFNTALQNERETRRRERTQRVWIEQLGALSEEQKALVQRLESEIGKRVPGVPQVNEQYRPLKIGFVQQEGTVKGFSLYYYSLQSVPETLRSFSEIEYLDLSGNMLTAIPDWISSFRSLKQLKLLANKITQLPESIGGLSNLEILDLSGNKLIDLPESILELPALKFLHIWANDFNTPPEVLHQLRAQGINIIM